MARILVVDDDEDIRKVIVSALSEEGHVVAPVADGQSALDFLADNERPELMILDVMMPKLDGFDVLKEMRSRGIRESTKVLLLTARSSEHDWARGYRLGADYYLTKPFDIDELAQAVEEVLVSTKAELKSRRERELSKAQLLSKLESLFED